MVKLTPEEVIFKSMLESSKSKVLSKVPRMGGVFRWVFKDSDGISFSSEFIGGLIRKDLVTFGLMTLESYHNAKWIGG